MITTTSPTTTTNVASAVAVDVYGFLFHPGEAYAPPTPTLAGEEGEGERMLLANERQWWVETLQADAAAAEAEAAVAADGDTRQGTPEETGESVGVSALALVRRQLAAAWRARMRAHGGLPSPTLRRRVWMHLVGAGLLCSPQRRAADAQAYMMRAEQVEQQLRARRTQGPQVRVACSDTIALSDMEEDARLISSDDGGDGALREVQGEEGGMESQRERNRNTDERGKRGINSVNEISAAASCAGRPGVSASQSHPRKAPIGQEESPFVLPHVLETILRDLPRTFPSHCLFTCPVHSGVGAAVSSAVAVETAVPEETTPPEVHESDVAAVTLVAAVSPSSSANTRGGTTVVDAAEGQRQLLRLLGVYSTIDREVDYCQGMAFVAGLMLLQAPEAEAFTLFRRSFQGRALGVRRLYLPGFPLLATLLSCLQKSMRGLLPRLHAHFAKEGVAVRDFAAQWFLTFFITQLPIPVISRLWDCFLLEGWTVWVRVAVGLLASEERALQAMDMESTLLHLQECARHKWPRCICGRSEAEVVMALLRIPVGYVPL